MTAIRRTAIWAIVLVGSIVLGLPLLQARAEEPAQGPMSLAMVIPAPLDQAATPLAEPVLLCGNRWVTGVYVLGSNCRSACQRKFGAACTAQLIEQCTNCWRRLQECAKDSFIPAAQRCARCSERYAFCMRGFL